MFSEIVFSEYSQQKQTPSYHYETDATINPETDSFDILPLFFPKLTENGNLLLHLVPGYSFLCSDQALPQSR